MTIKQFRSNPLFTSRMRELIEDSTVQTALLAIADNNLPSEPADSSEALASVRRLSRAVGYRNAIRDFLSLADPLPVAPPEEESTYDKNNA